MTDLQQDVLRTLRVFGPCHRLVWKMGRALCTISRPVRVSLAPSGSYTQGFEEPSMSEQSTTAAVVYKDIPGFPGYRVGSDGSVWGRQQAGWRGRQRVLLPEWRELKPHVAKRDGHSTVRLSRHGKKKTFKVATLVLLAFVGPRPDGMEACHFPDKNRRNSSLANLRWGTHADNMADAIVHGTTHKGERSPMTTLAVSDVVEIRQRCAAGEAQAAIARSKGISPASVNDIVRRKRWGHVP